MKYELEVEKRDQAGKGVARQLRRQGKIPGVLYGGGKSEFVAMDHKIARNLVLSQVGHTGLLTVRVSGAEERIAVLQDHQIDPLTGAILHVDLFEVSMKKPIRVRVPVTVIGEVPLGVKEGGILHQLLRELHIECLPAQIPDHIEIDASGFGVGDGVHVKEVEAPTGVKILDDEDLMVAHVASKMSEAKLESLLVREAGEGVVAPVATAEVAAPGAVAAAPDSKAKEGKK
ncbi:MAG TPA: 50S ribosomal protein L25 [Nitrospirales bacterium]|nr:50S ribosomal protein L25 [Nitrospiraceae bacterium]HNP29242.1 50S ribosomal protein L25 [Nitrospirales bacterium]